MRKIKQKWPKKKFFKVVIYIKAFILSRDLQAVFFLYQTGVEKDRRYFHFNFYLPSTSSKYRNFQQG